MMSRQTSIDVYHRIQKEGLLSKRRWEVYDVLYRFGVQTSAEVVDRINSSKHNVNPLSQSRARFTELRDMGVVEEMGTKLCEITGNNVIAWRVTDNLPKIIIKETKAQKIKRILNDIKDLGIRLPEEYKQDLRLIYHEVEKI